MIDTMMRQDLDYFIDCYYKEVNDEPNYVLNDALTKETYEEDFKKEAFQLEELIKNLGKTFHETLFVKIDERKMTDVEVYKQANLDRKLFSKIRSTVDYHPRKQTVLALAIALRLNIEETEELLQSAEYAFSPGNKGDIIVKYFIEKEIYDIMLINYVLMEYGQQTLGRVNTNSEDNKTE